jgi:hypothetical protein
MAPVNAADEDWRVLLSFLPPTWKQLAREAGALKGLRQDKSEENYLRVLLLHLGCGLSMRETVVRAQEARLAELSDVALLKRVRKSREWLFQLCRALFEERRLQPARHGGHSLRLVDSTEIKEPGQTGSLWRIHYSLQWPSWKCDFFKLTPVEGAGTGEHLQQFPLQPGDQVVADRGYSHASGVHYVSQQKAFVTVRLNPQSLALQDREQKAFPLLKQLKCIRKAGQTAVWEVLVPCLDEPPVAARLCVIRKSQAAIALAQKRLRRKESKNGSQLQPETLVYAEYVMVLTTLPAARFSGEMVLQLYRFRWQIELVFKRFKQIAQLGHVPKHDPASAQAWLYGKLFVALLTEKLIQEARALSPWGYALEAAQPLEGVRFRLSPGRYGHLAQNGAAPDDGGLE